MIEDIKRSSEASECLLPLYFYCARGTGEIERSEPDQILASIVAQLSNTGLKLPTAGNYSEKRAYAFASSPLQLEESCMLVLELIEQYPITTIVIDSPHECDPKTRRDLLESLRAIVRGSSSLVKLFVSSRDDQDLVDELQDFSNIEISSQNNSDDIEAFVRTDTETLVKKKAMLRNSHVRDEL